jgi:hypothetical protein
MPNHFHLLVKQSQRNGIPEFMQKVQDSFAKYKNTRYKRTGGLYEGPFRAMRVKTENQLLHLSRYIHLNPHTSRVVPSLKELHDYPWTSCRNISLKIGDLRNRSSSVNFFITQTIQTVCQRSCGLSTGTRNNKTSSLE